jgi:Zn finger protein HypA/HybF involved in hydrogenase expression
MHEWALAEAVISSVTEIVEKEGLIEVTEVAQFFAKTGR